MSDSPNPIWNESYFTVFGLPRRLHLDAAALEKSFYAQSRRLHPDRFAAKPVAEQEAALAQSSFLNDAYRTLKEPVLRTQYLLTLEGVELEEQSKAATEAARTSGTAKKQIVPPELLEEVFELNMQLMEMKAAKQMGEDEPELRRDLLAAKQSFDDRMAATQTELENLWTAWDQAEEASDRPAMDKAKDAMVTLLNKRSYLRNLVRDVNETLSE
ncbi:Fe-S protein assembly co-chaperone HscB [Granulicella sp. WH15]|uniref:Fe-S protein assembly co-chaperone HscB n=1 Tax=Granulicella sp. WH15 TaxID=2602070 RepID=UPI0013673923|nr:Fe-S protein assembly co-chaperone HscB [Granulicella sp. WH15]QHN05157.1 Fe-S protein assembly co-chaperone HscB [Granulicella sp. WH15]